MGTAVRLQHDDNLPNEVLTLLVDELELRADDLYPSEGFPAFADLFQLYGAVDLPGSRTGPWPASGAGVRGRRDCGARSGPATSWSIIPINPSMRSRASSSEAAADPRCWRSR